jgi:hypothetical protein
MGQAWLLSQWGVALWLNLALVALALLSPQKALTRAGVLHAGLLGLLVWGGPGRAGLPGRSRLFFSRHRRNQAGDPPQAGPGDRRKARGGARAGKCLGICPDGSCLCGGICAFCPSPLVVGV